MSDKDKLCQGVFELAPGGSEPTGGQTYTYTISYATSSHPTNPPILPYRTELEHNSGERRRKVPKVESNNSFQSGYSPGMSAPLPLPLAPSPPSRHTPPPPYSTYSSSFSPCSSSSSSLSPSIPGEPPASSTLKYNR